MRTLTVTALCFGKIVGTLTQFEKHDLKELEIAVFTFHPSKELLASLRSAPRLKAIIIPSISMYSHYASEIWFSRIPCIATDRIDEVLLYKFASVDAEDGTLILSDERIWSETHRDLNIVRSQPTTPVPASVASSFLVFGEPNHEIDLVTDIREGNYEPSIVKSEMFLSNGGLHRTFVEDFREAWLRKRPNKKLKLRFFDSDQDANENSISVSSRGFHRNHPEKDLFVKLVSSLQPISVIAVLPMVRSPFDVQEARDCFKDTVRGIGVTAETPAAVLLLSDILQHVCFVEIGVNDLTQFTLAWDRNEPNSAILSSEVLSPAVEKLVAAAVAQCEEEQIDYVVGFDLRPSEKLLAQMTRLKIRSISCPAPLVMHWRRVRNLAS